MEECKAACLENPKCAAVDFSNTNEFIDNPSCRLFDSTKFDSDSRMNQRRFCAKGDNYRNIDPRFSWILNMFEYYNQQITSLLL